MKECKTVPVVWQQGLSCLLICILTFSDCLICSHQTFPISIVNLSTELHAWNLTTLWRMSLFDWIRTKCELVKRKCQWNGFIQDEEEEEREWKGNSRIDSWNTPHQWWGIPGEKGSLSFLWLTTTVFSFYRQVIEVLKGISFVQNSPPFKQINSFSR